MFFVLQLAEPEMEQVWVKKYCHVISKMPTIVCPEVSSHK